MTCRHCGYNDSEEFFQCHWYGHIWFANYPDGLCIDESDCEMYNNED